MIKIIKNNKILKGVYRYFIQIITLFSPTLASKILYRISTGKHLDLNNPEGFNEKIMWLKLNTYNDNELVTMCADKYKVREYVSKNNLDMLLNKLIGVWDSPDDINWEEIPNQFVLKGNHGSGYNFICNDKSKVNIEKIEHMANRWMNEDFWKKLAEVNYKNIEKKIICETMIESENKNGLNDYKVYCFNGEALYIMVSVKNKNSTGFYFYDKHWNVMPFNKDSQEIKDYEKIKKPNNLGELLEYAEILSQPFPFVRADFYLNRGKIIFGELTFTPSSGLDTGYTKEADKLFSDLIQLPQGD